MYVYDQQKRAWGYVLLAAMQQTIEDALPEGLRAIFDAHRRLTCVLTRIDAMDEARRDGCEVMDDVWAEELCTAVEVVQTALRSTPMVGYTCALYGLLFADAAPEVHRALLGRMETVGGQPAPGAYSDGG